MHINFLIQVISSFVIVQRERERNQSKLEDINMNKKGYYLTEISGNLISKHIPIIPIDLESYC